MEVWLATFDRAVRCLQNTDKPSDLARILTEARFPIDWVPEDGTTLAACQKLYQSTSSSVDASRSAVGDSGKAKPRNRNLLMIAAKLGRLECVKWLVGPPLYSSPFVASKFDGNTPLHIAVAHARVDIVKFLLQNIGPGARLLTNT